MATPIIKSDTIVALATPPGRGAISIVRISGQDVQQIGSLIMGQLPAPRYASLRRLKDGNGVAFDQAIVIYYEAPNTYTGEDLLEIQTHGGEAVVSILLSQLIAAGARLAEPGEFSKRAFLNEKIDLLQAEAVADLISASSERAARSAYSALSGKFSDEVEAINKQLKHLRTEIEAHIDFPEEEIPLASLQNWREVVAEIGKDLQTLLSAANKGAKLNHGIDIAIIGPPNAGKSTLLNAFAGADKAITSDIPGTTRDVVSVDVVFGGVNLRFHDTAGLRERTSDAIEEEGIKRTINLIESVDLCLLLEDSTGAEKTRVSSLMDSIEAETIEVCNKIDLCGQSHRIEQSDTATVCYLSAKTGEGVENLLTLLIKKLALNVEDESPFLARDRHLMNLREAQQYLGNNFDDGQFEIELVAEKLRIAQTAIGRLLGEYTSEDLLGDIFSTFCIGK
ncbi:MAG: tRNA uridine-5-carboxymethylaminomethyl(34) synthesis GTPase MnmE [Pseudomonadota bacterium]